MDQISFSLNPFDTTELVKYKTTEDFALFDNKLWMAQRLERDRMELEM